METVDVKAGGSSTQVVNIQPPVQNNSSATIVTLAQENKGQKFACEKCSLVFRHKEMHRRHMNVHAEKFKCPTCGKCFQSNYYLVRHHKRLGSCELILRQQRQNYNVACPMCDFKTTSKVNLRSHLIRHTDKNQCKVCKHTFLRQRDLLTHLKSPVNCNKYLMMWFDVSLDNIHVLWCNYLFPLVSINIFYSCSGWIDM